MLVKSVLLNELNLADGDLWKQQRRIARFEMYFVFLISSHLFAAKELKGFMLETFLHHSQMVAISPISDRTLVK